MKEKIHLIYGIIIGILLFACLGSSKDDQKEFKEIQKVFWDESAKMFGSSNPGGYFSDVTITSKKGSPDDLRKAGWTIIDFELIPNVDLNSDLITGKSDTYTYGVRPYYLIGK